MKAKILIIPIILILLASLIASQTETTSKNNIISMNIITEKPTIITSTGTTSQLTYEFKKIGVDEWETTYCHKDYEKNFLNKEEKDKDKFKKIKIKIEKGTPTNLPAEINAEKECGKFTFKAKKGDQIRIGENTTIIEITATNVTFSVNPENSYCSYLYCEAKIIIVNNDETNITINSSDINIEISQTKEQKILFSHPYQANITDYFLNETNGTTIFTPNGSHTETRYETKNVQEGKKIIILPQQNKTLYIKAIMNTPNNIFKYNITFNYLGEEYSIDPYFHTSGTSFNNGTYNQTLLNESGFVQLNNSLEGTYTSEIFDAGANSTWNNISWIQGGYYQKELPNNRGIDEGDHENKIDMNNNFLLFHFNETTGNINDYSGEENNGVIHNFEGDEYGVLGIFNTGLEFDGINDYVAINGINTIFNSKNWIIEFWFKVNSTPIQQQFIISFWQDTNNEVRILINTDGSFSVTYESNNVAHNLKDFSNLCDGKFHHVYVTMSSTLYSLYVDGRLVGDLDSSSWAGLSITKSQLGCRYTSVSGFYRFFEGIVDELAIYNIPNIEALIHYERGVEKLNLSVRSCDDNNCSGENFTNTNNPSPQNLSVLDNQYFQYRFLFLTENINVTPKLYNVTIGDDTNNSNCTENWIAQYEACQTNDSQFKTYNDNNNCNTTNDLPVDNGTWVICDYCYEDLQQTLGECQPNGTQTVDYTDNNYASCCEITSLISDCSVDYFPYNETTYQNCTYYTKDFNCTIDEKPILNKKINVICEMPDNQTYCCVINIYQNNNLLATTPEYKSTTNSLLSMFSEKEERECFTPKQRLLNAYYTKKELRPETLYTLEILCTKADGTTIKSQYSIKPEYHEYDWLPHRITSIGDKPILTTVTILAIILILLLIIWGIKKVRGH